MLMGLDQYTIFLILATISAAFSLGVAIYAFRKPSIPGAIYVVIYHLLVAAWLITNSLELIWPTADGTRLFAKITYLFFINVPSLWFVFVLEYTGHREWLNPIKYFLLFSPGVLTVFLVWTNEMHNLIWTSIRYVPAGRFLSMQVEHGFFYYLQMAYYYCLIVIGFTLLIERYLKAKKKFRTRTLALVTAAIFPFVFHIIYLFHLIPGLSKDFSPIVYAISGIAIASGFYFNQLFDDIPVIRDVVVDHMQDAMLVIDHQDRIVDCNLAALSLFKRTQKELLYLSIVDFLPQWADWVKNASPDHASNHHYSLDQQQYEVKLSLYENFQPDEKTILVFFKDVSEQTQLIKQLNTLAIFDSLLNLHNRRHFMDLSAEMIQRMAAQNQPLSLLMIDLDLFKMINDTYGHPIGDQVLQVFGNYCRQFIGEHDILARFDRDEFIILLSMTALEQALQIAERLRAEVVSLPIQLDELSIHLSVSIGVACIYPDENSQMDALIANAEKGVSLAKQSGGNQVVPYPAPDQPDQQNVDENES